MSTFMAKAGDIKRKWYIIDAEGKTLGKVAVLAATILNGKHTPAYTPHVDCGDCVVIINAAKVVLTGKKLDQKIYYTHSGYPGGLKETKYSKIMQNNPGFAIKLAVKGMLPKNSIGRHSLKRLRVYNDAVHGHDAQKPEALNNGK